MDNNAFDFWYAVNNTEVLQLPNTTLDTFGTSMVNYHLITEVMDSTTKVRIREGKIEAYKPQIIMPPSFDASMLEGFGAEAEQYAGWLRDHESELMFLKYGFAIKKSEVNDYIITDKLSNVVDRVKHQLVEEDDPMSALIVGVEEPWEVCLLKLMVEVIQLSSKKHMTDLRNDPDGRRHEIESAFLTASKDHTEVDKVAEVLQKHGLFEQYQDRFFSLVRTHQ